MGGGFEILKKLNFVITIWYIGKGRYFNRGSRKFWPEADILGLFCVFFSTFHPLTPFSKTRTTIVVSNGRYNFYQISFIQYLSSNTVYQITFFKNFYQILFAAKIFFNESINESINQSVNQQSISRMAYLPLKSPSLPILLIEVAPNLSIVLRFNRLQYFKH